MEEPAASARLVCLVTRAIFKARLLPCTHFVRDCSCLAGWDQGQATQDAGYRHYPDHLARLWQIQHLGSYLGCTLPPWLGFTWAVVPQCFDHCTSACHQGAVVAAHMYFEHQDHSPIPALVDRWTEFGSLACVIRWRWDEKNKILQRQQTSNCINEQIGFTI